jgi:chloramphenicol 3-O phosphotransferase
MYPAFAVLASEGNNLIIDDVLFDPRALREAVCALEPLGALFVGVRCPLEVTERREPERGVRTLGLARAHYALVHAPGVYDLEVDTSISTPTECALQIRRRLVEGPAPAAFRRLRENWAPD